LAKFIRPRVVKSSRPHVYLCKAGKRRRLPMDGSAPQGEDWEREIEWEQAGRREFPLLPVVIVIAALLLLLVILRPG